MVILESPSYHFGMHVAGNAQFQSELPLRDFCADCIGYMDDMANSLGLKGEKSEKFFVTGCLCSLREVKRHF